MKPVPTTLYGCLMRALEILENKASIADRDEFILVVQSVIRYYVGRVLRSYGYRADLDEQEDIESVVQLQMIAGRYYRLAAWINRMKIKIVGQTISKLEKERGEARNRQRLARKIGFYIYVACRGKTLDYLHRLWQIRSIEVPADYEKIVHLSDMAQLVRRLDMADLRDAADRLASDSLRLHRQDGKTEELRVMYSKLARMKLWQSYRSAGELAVAR